VTTIGSGETMNSSEKFYREWSEQLRIMSDNTRLLDEVFSDWADNAARPIRHNFEPRQWLLHKRGCTNDHSKEGR